MKSNGDQKKVLFFRAVLQNRRVLDKDHPYRIIAIPGELSLHNLADVIVRSFDFDFHQPFGFYSDLEKGSDSEFGYESKKKYSENNRFGNTKNWAIEEVFVRIKMKWLFLYNDVEEWRFTVELIEVETYPKVIARQGKAPPQYESG